MQSDVLRKSLAESDLSLYRIAKDIGISQSVLGRFMSEERNISMANFDLLCEYLGLALVPIDQLPAKRKKKAAKKKRPGG